MVPANNKNRLPIFAIFALFFFVCICPASFSTVQSEQQDHDVQSTAAAELALATEKQPWLGAGRSRIVAGLSIVIVSLVGNVLGGLSNCMFGGGKGGKVCSLMAQAIFVWIGHKIGYGGIIGAVIVQIIGFGPFGSIIGKLFSAFGYKKEYGQLLGVIFGTCIGLEMGYGCMLCALVGGLLGIGFGAVIGPLLLESIGGNLPIDDDNNKLIQLELCKEIGMAIGTWIGFLIRLLFIHYGFVFTICACILAALYCFTED